MTDRHAGYVVTLEADLREDDSADTINAIRQIRGVIDVVPLVTDAMTHIGQSRAEHAIERRLWAALYPAKE